MRHSGQSVLLEMPLPNGRRADIFAVVAAASSRLSR